MESNFSTFKSLLSIFEEENYEKQSIQKLNLSSNLLSNKNIEEIAQVFNQRNKLKLTKLDLSNNKFNVKGVVKLFQSLKNNNQVKITHMNLDKTNFDMGISAD